VMRLRQRGYAYGEELGLTRMGCTIIPATLAICEVYDRMSAPTRVGNRAGLK